MEFTELSPVHDDLVHDIAFDYYGKRFATCSSDKHIKIWTLDEEKGSWSSFDFKAHQNSVWRLSWANPEYGQLLASCSEDGTICLWEEQEATTISDTSQERWRKFRLASHKRSIKDVKFCHRSFGLKLAAASADGCIRIYEAQDIFDMNKWEMMIEYQVEDISNPDKSRNSSEHGLTCLAWNDCPFEPAMIAVGGYSKTARVYSFDRNTLKEECSLGDHVNPVHDIAWAPSMGRSYHLIATASRESTFKIHKLVRTDSGSLACVSTLSVKSSTPSTIWRVAWNATGTVLATSAEDGTLSLWRRDFAGSWINVQDLPSGVQHQMTYFYQNP